MESAKEELVCVCESGYDLTRGKRYLIEDSTDIDEQVRVRSDRGRSRWFPRASFAPVGAPLVRLVSWYLEDSIIDPILGLDAENNTVGVVVQLDDGSNRRCDFTTPEQIRQLLEHLALPNTFMSIRSIIVTVLSEQIIERTLRLVDSNNELTHYTTPINNLNASAAIGEQ